MLPVLLSKLHWLPSFLQECVARLITWTEGRNGVLVKAEPGRRRDEQGRLGPLVPGSWPGVPLGRVFLEKGNSPFLPRPPVLGACFAGKMTGCLLKAPASVPAVPLPARGPEHSGAGALGRLRLPRSGPGGPPSGFREACT